MLNRKQHNRKVRGGFTLIEAIVTVTIIAIVAAVVVPSGIGFIKSAGQSGRNKTARNIFLAAQKAMSSENASGLWDSSEWAKMGTTIPGIKEANTGSAESNLRYLSIDKKSGDKTTNALFMLLDPYIADKGILEDSILIEYNVNSKKIVSAFYSDEVGAFVYGNRGNDSFNVVNRTAEALKEGRVGFYGVEDLSIEDKTEATDVAIQLVDYDKYYSDGETSKGYNVYNGKNYGLLTAEMILPENYEEKTLNISIRGNGTENYEITGTQLQDIKTRSNVNSAIENPVTLYDKTNGCDMKIPAFIFQNYGPYKRSVLVMILDCQKSAYGIAKHEALGCSLLSATLSVVGADGKEEISCATDTNNPVHSMFSSVEGYGQSAQYVIKSVRHLNNIRLMESDSLPNNFLGTYHHKYAKQKTILIENQNAAKYYVQADNVYCRDYANNILNWKPIGADRKFDESYNDAGSIFGFTGYYKGNNFKIYDLGMDENCGANMTGLFTSVTTGASVDGVDIDYTKGFRDSIGNSPYISGKYIVGGIAAENWGVISNCTVHGNIQAMSQSDDATAKNGVRAGGIAGKNMRHSKFYREVGVEGGIITKCRVVADVTSINGNTSQAKNAFAGGIAAENYADITYCEVGTSAETDNGVDTAYYGAGSNDKAKYTGKINEYTIKGYYAGGIAACSKSSAYGDDTVIKYCVNASIINGGSHAGGIVGYSLSNALNDTCGITPSLNSRTVKILLSYNAGKVGITDGDLKTTNAGGICAETNSAGTGNSVKISSCYNTGEINARQAAGIIKQIGRSSSVSDSYNIGNVYGTASSNSTDGIYINLNGVYKKDALHNCVTLDSVSTQLDNAAKTESELKECLFDGLTTGETAGAFNYPYPYIVSDDSVSIKFHRTPWK